MDPIKELYASLKSAGIEPGRMPSQACAEYLPVSEGAVAPKEPCRFVARVDEALGKVFNLLPKRSMQSRQDD